MSNRHFLQDSLRFLLTFQDQLGEVLRRHPKEPIPCFPARRPHPVND
ncbi:hypothetical protein [Chitinophaga parva]|nr:hypothetical protein [Chitinophaga parva]